MAVKLTAVKLVEILPRGRNQAQQGLYTRDYTVWKDVEIFFRSVGGEMISRCRDALNASPWLYGFPF